MRRSYAGRQPGSAIAAAVIVAVALGQAPRPARAETREAVRPKFEGLEPRAGAEATYGVNAYEIIHVESTAIGFLWNTTTAWWRPVRGVYRQPTSYGDFYRALGRPDLADQEATRHATAELLFWGGVAAMVGGVVAGGYELSKQRKAGAIVGAGLVVGGYVSVCVGGALSRPGVPEAEAQQLSDLYNQALGRHLGLSVKGSF